MSIGRFCNREVVVATASTTIPEIARLMRQHHVGDVVIVEDNPNSPRPLGILTDRDLVVELLACDVALDAVRAGDLMSWELATAREEDSLWETLQIMRNRGIRRMVVVNGKDGLEGIITVDDLLELLAEELILLARIPACQQLRETKQRS